MNGETAGRVLHTLRQPRAMEGLLALFERYEERKITSIDWQLPHPIEVYEVDEHGERAARPYRCWELPDGPWLLVTLDDEEFAIWKLSGDVYRVDPFGAVEEDPIIEVKR